MDKKLPLLNALLDYHKEENTIFSMPGNKCGLAFERDEIGKVLANNLGRLDITEVDPLDNLHHPEGVIKESQELLAKYYGVKKAYFMVNGSSGGNLTSIFSAFKEGDEVLVERNCHKSIYNAIVLRKLKVTYIEPVIIDDTGLFLPPDKENIYKALERCENPKGIILTYPNYFGISYDIEEIIKDMQSRGLKVIIDEAHGAHYGVCDYLPKNVASISDYTVVSAHKTIPALTGGSYLLVNDDEEDIQFYISSFMTTSPSYLIMASLDYARYYLDTYGKSDYEELIEFANEEKKKINNQGKVRVLSKEDLPKGYDIDSSRYVLLLPKGYSGNKLQDYLRSKKIQCEMSFFSGVVLILSPANYKNGLKELYKALEELDMDILINEEKSIKFNNIIPKKILEPYEVFNHKGEWIDINNSVGRIVKESIVPYPPGIPLVCIGEEITWEIIDKIKRYLDEGISILGINVDKVFVVKY